MHPVIVRGTAVCVCVGGVAGVWLGRRDGDWSEDRSGVARPGQGEGWGRNGGGLGVLAWRAGVLGTQMRMEQG